MKKIIFAMILFLFLSTSILSQTTIQFDKFFIDKTMRMDYYHTGIKGHETISLDAVYEEPPCKFYEKQPINYQQTKIEECVYIKSYTTKTL